MYGRTNTQRRVNSDDDRLELSQVVSDAVCHVPLPGIVECGVAQSSHEQFCSYNRQNSDHRTPGTPGSTQHFNDKNSLFGRYSFNNVDTFTPDSFPEVGVHSSGYRPIRYPFPGPGRKERQQSLGS